MVTGTVLDYQRDKSHFNHLGKHLDEDGVLGPETRWSMDFQTLAVERRLVIATAQGFLWLVEIPPGSNSDPTHTIERMLKRCGAKPGDAWCASALSEWLSSAIPVAIPGALNLGLHFPETATPFAGDVYTFPTDDKGHGHCGLVIGVGSTEIMGIEGNSNNAVRCVRRARASLRFGRTFDDTLGTCPKVILTVPPAGGGTR